MDKQLFWNSRVPENTQDNNFPQNWACSCAWISLWLKPHSVQWLLKGQQQQLCLPFASARTKFCDKEIELEKGCQLPEIHVAKELELRSQN